MGCVGACDLPGIAEGQPVLRVFQLPAVADDLAEHAVIVADAVTVRGDTQRRHALHEAGGQPPEAAIAQRGVVLDVAQLVVVHAQFGERRTHAIDQAQVVQRIMQQPADEEFQRQVIDALAARDVVACGLTPSSAPARGRAPRARWPRTSRGRWRRSGRDRPNMSAWRRRCCGVRRHPRLPRGSECVRHRRSEIRAELMLRL